MTVAAAVAPPVKMTAPMTVRRRDRAYCQSPRMFKNKYSAMSPAAAAPIRSNFRRRLALTVSGVATRGFVCALDATAIFLRPRVLPAVGLPQKHEQKHTAADNPHDETDRNLIRSDEHAADDVASDDEHRPEQGGVQQT